ncbi:MAG: transposase [Pseudomonadota bacterium]
MKDKALFAHANDYLVDTANGITLAYRVCPLKSRCCPHVLQRRIVIHIHEGARDVARQITESDTVEETRQHRKKVEMALAHLKRILRMDHIQGSVRTDRDQNA